MSQTVVQQISQSAPGDLQSGEHLIDGQTIAILAKLLQNPGLIGGSIVYTGIPTADPHVVGALYSNSGVLTVSSG